MDNEVLVLLGKFLRVLIKGGRYAANRSQAETTPATQSVERKPDYNYLDVETIPYHADAETIPHQMTASQTKPEKPQKTVVRQAPPADGLTTADIQKIGEEIRRLTLKPWFQARIDKTLPTSLTCSKIGGLAYWPRGVPAPEPIQEDPKEIRRFVLLAQLNLSDFKGDTRLPDHGLLQFFMVEENTGWDEQNDFKVVWHETIDPMVTEAAVRAFGMSAAESEDFPVQGEYALTISPSMQSMNYTDVRFPAVFDKAVKTVLGDGFDLGETDCTDWIYDLSKEDRDVFDRAVLKYYLRDPNNTDLLDVGSGVLGYPYFTQDDPRSLEDAEYYDTVLLQLDSDMGARSPSDAAVMWGDDGVGRFFINSEALAKGDFSRVLFSADCY